MTCKRRFDVTFGDCIVHISDIPSMNLGVVSRVSSHLGNVTYKISAPLSFNLGIFV